MKLIEVISHQGNMETIIALATRHGVDDYWLGPENDDGRQAIRLLVRPEVRQEVLDALQALPGGSEDARILVFPLEASLPPVNHGSATTVSEAASTATREELYQNVSKGARLDNNFLLLVMLSTLVASIGLIMDNTAAVIGAMVIAPLLGPNIALALGTALGDKALMWQAMKSNLAGLTLALSLAMFIGLLWPSGLQSQELASRTDVGLDSVVLALASGAAAILSLTTGLSSVLVGVMVAVALLPPTATLGLMLGSGQWQAAAGAALLLAVNVVCVNLAGKLVLLAKGVKPRTWLLQKKASQSITIYIMIWLASLAFLIGIILLRHLSTQ